MAKKRLLLSGSDEIIPIAKALKDDYDFFALMQPTAKMLKDIDIPCTPIGENVPVVLHSRSLTETARIMSSVITDLPQIVERLPVGARDKFQELIPGFLYQHLGNLALVVLLLDHYKIDGVVLHNDVEPLMRIAAAWARARGKKCLHQPHAIYHEYEKTAPGTDIHDMITASHLAAAGPYQRVWYEKRGFPPENIRETGMLKYDKFVTMGQWKDHARKLLKLDPYRHVVMYFTSWRQDTNLLGCNNGIEEAFVQFLSAMKTMPNVDVLVKSRQSDNLKWHIDTAKNSGIRCLVVAQHLEVCLQAADLVTGYGPTNGFITSAILGKRTVSINGFPDDPEVITVASDTNSMREGIIKSFSEPVPQYLPFLLKYIGPPDGQATKRVIEYVKELFA